MIEIEENFSAYRLGDVQRLASDGYIGIPVQLSVYYDGEEGVTSGIGGTPLILYVVNTATERIGTKTDTQIIRSMLDRGYLVCVIDYLESAKATTPALDWSLQSLRANINAGKYFSGMGIPTADYKETFVVPAGYDVSLSHSYWEIDKHSAAGTLEYITKVWNTDVRSIFADRLIYWRDAEGNRKSVQTAYDGTAPVWLNASGAADENGSYIKIKHTLANSVEDCAKPDGSPIDMNLYMHIIYPTAPKNEVPVMCFAASSEHLADAAGTAGRPQLNGFVFSGYAGVLVDYGYVPMARADHYKEFSGTAGVTGDNVTYSIAFYNGVKINTAAMRYLRYLGASDETFAFDSEAIGIYGNSKGGWMMMLGAEHPELLSEQRFFVGHHGESRYEAGETADSASGRIKGGEAQPWLTYNGEALDSGADFIYASCGGGEQHIMDGHAPTFVSCNIGDGTFYATSNNFVNYCRNHDVPCLWFEVDKGHTFTYGEDMNFGVDTYGAFFTFANYYLRGDAVSVVYTSFTKKNTDVDPIADIVIKFSGAVSAEAVETIAVTAVGGEAVSGTWSSQFGNTEWTFRPSAPLAFPSEYTLRVPETLAGDNGVAMGTAYTQSFTTEESEQTAASFAEGTRGGYYFFTVGSDMKAAKKVFLRFAVSCDGTNLAGVYPVSGFSAASPDASSVAASSIGSIPIFGSGVYSCDVAAYVKTLSVGDTAAFLVKMERNVGNSSVFSAPMDTAVQGSLSKASGAIASDISGIEGAGALKLSAFQTNVITGSKESITYYNNTSSVLAISNLIKNGALANADLGRRFTVSFRVYDTVSRKISVSLNGATSSVQGVADYNVSRYNFMTSAGEWTDITFTYTVHEPLLGAAGLISKKLTVSADTLGDIGASYPFYIDSVLVTESASAVSLGAASVAYDPFYVDTTQTPYGQIDEAYADIDAYPIAVFVKNGSAWEFKSASATLPTSYGYGADAVILLRKDVKMSAAVHDLDTMGAGRTLTIDLGGHTLDMTGAGQYNSFAFDSVVDG
ncbi:MAG: Ig-like domain-containing protein, partial [Clostridia bacterium]|nr:Ig-like domain-containing protein [Clostridia bacterium]